MKNLPGRSSVAVLISVSVCVRLFRGIAADRPTIPNAGWICPLVGLVIWLPVCFAAARAEKLGNGSVWGNLRNSGPRLILHGAELFFSLILLYDCALTMRLTAITANVLALGEVSILLLLLPLGGLVAADVLLGADAVGNSARLWIRILPVTFLVVFIVQVRVYNPSWLAPVLGSGARDILDGGIYAGGCIALLTLPWLAALPDRSKKPLILYVGIGVLAAALLLAANQMLTPPLEELELNRTNRIMLILGNGRAALSLQLILIVLWYGALLHLIGTEAAAAACYLKNIVPKAPQWTLAVGEAIAAVAAAYSGITGEFISRRLYPWLFAGIGTALTVVMLSCLLRKGGKGCEN